MSRRRTSRRGNRRYVDPHGDEWDSQFEWFVYNGLRDLGYSVRRCTSSDSIAYHSQVKQGRCLECGSDGTVQERIYTPDLYVADDPTQSRDERGGYFIECKGYWPAEKRSLLRQVKEQNPSLDLRVLFAKVAKLTPKRSNVAYVNDIIHATAGAWNDGNLRWYYESS